MKKKRLLSIVAVCLLMMMQIIIHDNANSQEIGNISPESEKTVPGFTYPESAAYDANENVVYVGQFGSEMKPTLKDGKGKISKVSLNGKILDPQFLPVEGAVLHKPKGIWIDGSRLWVTDIDVAWVFDLKSREGKEIRLPGVQFANDPTVIDNALYVSDTAGNKIFKIEPADFLKTPKAPQVTVPFADLSFSPNGLCPTPDGLLVVGYSFSGHDQGIYLLNPQGGTQILAESLGLLDGVCRLNDGSLLITDWRSKSLFRWYSDKKIETLLKGFKGPADFCVVPDEKGFTVVVPDLVKGELRIGHFRR